MVRAVAVPLLLTLAACAADKPGPAFPRSAPSRRSLVAAPVPAPRPWRLAAGRASYLAPTPAPVTRAAPAPAPAPRSDEMTRLRAQAEDVGNRYCAAVEVRRGIERVITLLSAQRKSRSPADARRMDEDIAAYKESCAMSKLPVAAVVLACSGLASCSSIDGKIAKLRSEENEVVEQINVLQDERKSIERLITALQEYQRSGNSRNSENLDKAREQYEVAKR